MCHRSPRGQSAFNRFIYRFSDPAMCYNIASHTTTRRRINVPYLKLAADVNKMLRLTRRSVQLVLSKYIFLVDILSYNSSSIQYISLRTNTTIISYINICCSFFRFFIFLFYLNFKSNVIFHGPSSRYIFGTTNTSLDQYLRLSEDTGLDYQIITRLPGFGPAVKNIRLVKCILLLALNINLNI